MPPIVAWGALSAWTACHLIYPFWAQQSFRLSALLFVGLLAAGYGMTTYLRPILRKRPLENGVAAVFRDWLPDNRFAWILATAVLPLVLYPATLPIDIFSVGDEMVHVALAALPFKVWARSVPVPFPAVFWSCAAIVFLCRRPLTRTARRLAERPLGFGAAALLFAAAAGYFATVYFTVRYFALHGHETLPQDLLRFPPLLSIMLMPLYAAFGIGSLAAHLPEMLFFAAYGLVLYRLASEFRPQPSALAALAAAWLTPAVFYYASKGTQTCGELFFYSLACYRYLAWRRDGDTRDLYHAALALSIGSLYRYTVVPMAGFLAAMGVLEIIRRRRAIPWRATFEILGILAALILPWVLSFYLRKEARRYNPFNAVLTPGIFLEVGRSFIHGASWPMVALAGLGAARGIFRRSDPMKSVLWIWFIGYYVFITLDLAGGPETMGNQIRFSAPLYPVLALWAADGATFLFGWLRWPAVPAAALAGFLLVISTWVHFPSVEREFTLRDAVAQEYLPLPQASEYLDQMPEGTKLLAVDASPGVFTLYLRNPKRVEWTQVYSKEIPSLDALRKICRDGGYPTVLMMGGTAAGFSVHNRPELFTEFESNQPDFRPRASFALGGNRIVLKDYLRR